MLEIPESVTISKQIADTFLGKMVKHVHAGQSLHGFGWYHPEPEEYPLLLEGKKLTAVSSNGGQVELVFKNMNLVFNDGTTPRYVKAGGTLPKKHQLLITFEDGDSLVCTVRMYGGMMIYPDGKTDNEYYLVSVNKPSPLAKKFDREYFQKIVDEVDPKLSAKALLATEQRIPGLGNGVLQDILFNARIHPQRKLTTLSSEDFDTIYDSVKHTLKDMADKGGRDVEKDFYGEPGGYKTILSNKTKDEPCPRCGDLIVKKAYMGGNVYFCPTCQPL